MAERSPIEWTGSTWTPIRARDRETGRIGWHCEHASEGCRFCYSEGINLRLGTRLDFKPAHRKQLEIFLDEKMLLAPLRWRKPRKIFVCSMTDAFADFVEDEWLDRMFAVMALAPRHTFQVLTKRAGRMRAYFSKDRLRTVSDFVAPFNSRDFIAEEIDALISLGHTPPGVITFGDWERYSARIRKGEGWPLPNVWLGVSVEQQREADERIPELLDTPAARRFLSCEPLLGPLDLRQYLVGHEENGVDWSRVPGSMVGGCIGWIPPVDWVICGGESGRSARPMHPDWARSLRDQCGSAEVPFFFKQWGEWLPGAQYTADLQARDSNDVFSRYDMARWDGDEWDLKADPLERSSEEEIYRVGKRNAGRIIDGRTHDDFPVERGPA